MQKTEPKMLKNQKNLSIFGLWDLDWSWLIISIQAMFWFFHFRTQKNICWVKTKHSLKSFVFWFCSNSLFFDFLLVHMIAICILMLACLIGPGMSNFDQSFSFKSLRAMWDQAWHTMCCDVVYALESCLKISPQDLVFQFSSFSVFQFFSFWPKISPQDSVFQFLNFWLPRFTQRVLCKSWNLGYMHTHSCLGLTYSSKKSTWKLTLWDNLGGMVGHFFENM